MTPEPASRRIAVIGATGYIGTRLVPRLLAAGYHVRCLVRSPRKLDDRPWIADPNITIVQAALTADAESADTADTARAASAPDTRLVDALRGCDAAYYLVHAMMSAGASYAEQDRAMARRFAAAAEAAGVTRIIYLGGLGETGAHLSEHLASRRDVERQLASRGVPVTTFRAAMIIGSGSASFEILRYLVERLPVMITPRWVKTESQPVAVRNVLHYLVAALETPATIGRTLDIGGPDVLSYRDLMHVMAEERGLRRRLILAVPVLTPTLSSLWIHLVTPLSHRIARPLAEGLRNRVVCRDDEAARLMPQRLLPVREAIRIALDLEAEQRVESSWTGAGPLPGDPDWAGGTVYVDERSMLVQASPDVTFSAVIRLGGPSGWHSWSWLWRMRGWIDRLVGGPGLRRGRRHPAQLSFGEALDFWRVTGVERPRRLTLRAEMRLPGEALLDFVIEPVPSSSATATALERRAALPAARAARRPSDTGGSAVRARELPATASEGAAAGTVCRLTQTARFLPRGLAGLLYWKAVTPFHALVFSGMLRGIARTAERAAEQPAASGDRLAHRDEVQQVDP